MVVTATGPAVALVDATHGSVGDPILPFLREGAEDGRFFPFEFTQKSREALFDGLVVAIQSQLVAFSTTKGTLYYRLQHRRTTFDTVVTLRVEGVSLSAIARIERLAWNTVARWLERAAAVCRRFSHGWTTGFVATELQADEIRTFTEGKTRPTWVFAAIEVWSRLWTSTVVGRRSYRNTLALVRDVSARMKFGTCPVIVTDGFCLGSRSRNHAGIRRCAACRTQTTPRLPRPVAGPSPSQNFRSRTRTGRVRCLLHGSCCE